MSLSDPEASFDAIANAAGSIEDALKTAGFVVTTAASVAQVGVAGTVGRLQKASTLRLAGPQRLPTTLPSMLDPTNPNAREQLQAFCASEFDNDRGWTPSLTPSSAAQIAFEAMTGTAVSQPAAASGSSGAVVGIGLILNAGATIPIGRAFPRLGANAQVFANISAGFGGYLSRDGWGWYVYGSGGWFTVNFAPATALFGIEITLVLGGVDVFGGNAHVASATLAGSGVGVGISIISSPGPFDVVGFSFFGGWGYGSSAALSMAKTWLSPVSSW